MRLIDKGSEKLLTDFDLIKICGKDALPIYPDLWKQCTTEEQYFQILAERQKKRSVETDPEFLNIQIRRLQKFDR